MSNQDPVDSKPMRAIFPKRRTEPEQVGGPIGEVMRRTEAALQQVQDSPSLDATEGTSEQQTHDKRRDPAPSAPAIAEERAQQLVTNISSQVLGELRNLREQIDGDIVLRHVRAEKQARLERGHAATGDEHARPVLLRPNR